LKEQVFRFLQTSLQNENNKGASSMDTPSLYLLCQKPAVLIQVVFLYEQRPDAAHAS
jgi:hypothetical protein